MANELTVTPPPAANGGDEPRRSLPADAATVDGASLLWMPRAPLIAVAWAAAAYAAHLAWAAVGPADLPNFGPLVVLCFGMVLAAWIDGYAFKVPTWLTLSLTVSGWYLGLLHDLGVAVDAGQGGVGS